MARQTQYRTYGVRQLVVDAEFRIKTETTWYAQRQVSFMGFKYWKHLVTFDRGGSELNEQFATEQEAWKACVRDYVSRYKHPITIPGREATLA